MVLENLYRESIRELEREKNSPGFHLFRVLLRESVFRAFWTLLWIHRLLQCVHEQFGTAHKIADDFIILSMITTTCIEIDINIIMIMLWLSNHTLWPECWSHPTRSSGGYLLHLQEDLESSEAPSSSPEAMWGVDFVHPRCRAVHWPPLWAEKSNMELWIHKIIR